MPPGDFNAEVLSPTGSEFPAVGFVITNAAGQVVVSATGPFESQWSAGVGNARTLLTTLMTISVDMGTTNPTGAGWVLMLSGTGSFANGTETHTLP